MRINFRQGLVSSEINGAQQPNYLVTASNGITIRTANRPVIFTVADGQKNYTISFTADVLAWPASMYRGVQKAWLYIDINRSTSQRTYGITTVAPQYGLTAPRDPVYGQHWFDTRQYTMKVFNERNSWQRVLRVIAGEYTPTRTSPMHVGTQIGIKGNYLSGSIMTDGFNKAIVDSNGQFITTEDVVMVEGAVTHAAKLESNVDVAPAKVSVPAFHVVAYGDDGQLRLADYDDVGVNVIGLSISNAVPGEPVSLVMQGKVHNALWNWPRANMTLWVGLNGELTPIDPFAKGGRAKRRVPVARTIDVDTVLFDQGLGGVGEKGDSGDLTGLQLASRTIHGISRLSVSPESTADPVAVGDNDPRMSDARVPLDHEHHAATVMVDEFDTFTGENAQQAFEYLGEDKLSTSGGTLTGPVQTVAPATIDSHLITLGQTNQQIEDNAVVVRRFLLNSAAETLVAAFNALATSDRTVEINNIIIVEYNSDVFMWTGGYGNPVTATHENQFALIGKLVAEALPVAAELSIRSISANLTVVPPVTNIMAIVEVVPDDNAERNLLHLYDVTTWKRILWDMPMPQDFMPVGAAFTADGSTLLVAMSFGDDTWRDDYIYKLNMHTLRGDHDNDVYVETYLPDAPLPMGGVHQVARVYVHPQRSDVYAITGIDNMCVRAGEFVHWLGIGTASGLSAFKFHPIELQGAIAVANHTEDGAFGTGIMLMEFDDYEPTPVMLEDGETPIMIGLEADVIDIEFDQTGSNLIINARDLISEEIKVFSFNLETLELTDVPEFKSPSGKLAVSGNREFLTGLNSAEARDENGVVTIYNTVDGSVLSSRDAGAIAATDPVALDWEGTALALQCNATEDAFGGIVAFNTSDWTPARKILSLADVLAETPSMVTTDVAFGKKIEDAQYQLTTHWNVQVMSNDGDWRPVGDPIVVKEGIEFQLSMTTNQWVYITPIDEAYFTPRDLIAVTVYGVDDQLRVDASMWFKTLDYGYNARAQIDATKRSFSFNNHDNAPDSLGSIELYVEGDDPTEQIVTTTAVITQIRFGLPVAIDQPPVAH